MRQKTITPAAILLLLFAGQCGVCVYYNMVESTPEVLRLQFEPKKFDGGVVSCGVPLRGVFSLQNSGDFPVQINDISKSCTCMDTSLEQGTVIQLGDELAVEVKVLSPADPGTVSRTTVLCEYVGLNSATSGLRGVATLTVSLRSAAKPSTTHQPITPVPDREFD